MQPASVLVCFAFACAASLAAHAEAVVRTEQEFIGAIREGVRRQPDYGTQQASVGQARGALSEARAEFFPRVQLLMDTGEDRAVRDGTAQDVAGSRQSGQVNPQLSLTQLLYDGGAAWGRVRAARGRIDAASSSVDSAANSLALQAVQIYFVMVRQREAVKYAEENLQKVASVRDKVAGRAAEGRDPQSELARLESRVLEARSQLMDARRDLDDAEAAYLAFFGEEPGDLFVPTERPARRSNADDSIVYARERSPELQALRDQLEASRADLDSERAAMFWPRLSLQATGKGYDTFGGGTDNRDTYIGVQVSYDAFDGGARIGRSRQAGGRLQAARFAVERADLELGRRMRQAYAAVAARGRQAGPLAERLAMDRRAIDDYEELFLAGRRSLNDLIVAQRDAFTSAMLLLDVQLDLRVQEFSVPMLTGELATYFGLAGEAP